jgi:hypothetical protein
MENLKNLFQKGWPYLAAVVFFIVMSYVYFSPVLQNKALSQMDQNHAIGMSKELVDFKEKTGEDSQWTNSMFGGMPAYQIVGGTSHSVYAYIQRFLRLSMPYTTVSILFIYMFGFYLLLLSLKFKNLQSVLGAVAFGLASYNIIIVAVGHITKTYAIAYMAPVIAGVLMAYRGKFLWGGILTTFALGVEISTNHVQVLYYLALMMVMLVIVKFIYAIKENELKKFAIASGILVLAAILAVLPNITNLATTYEYGKESIRGPSELTDKKKDDTGGTDRDYAYAWSYSPGESWTLMIPNAKGGASQPIGVDNPEYFDNVDSRFQNNIAKSSAYFGNQSFTAGPVYIGAIVVFLFILGLFLIQGPVKWWLLASSILGLFLSWGGNFQVFTDFFIDYVPLYNKFRTLSMALVIPSLAAVLGAMLVVKKIVEEPKILKENKMYLYIAFGLTGGISLLFYLAPTAFFDFLSANEKAFFDGEIAKNPQATNQYAAYISGLESVRINIFKADAIRSFAYILLSALLLMAFTYTQKIKKEYFVIGLIVLVLFDMWTIDKRYLNNEMFVKKRVLKNSTFAKTDADEMILKDKDPDYRVLSFLHSPFNDGFTPYFHKSIGGYHGAKLRRYQEVIENHLGRELQTIAYAYKNDTTNSISQVLSRMNVINMLNTKYIIYAANEYEMNWSALGHAWFVDDYELVNNADEEIAQLNKFNPKKTAIIDKRFEDVIEKLPEPEFFSLDTGYIELTSYKPNHLTYKSATKRERLAVFSEIYYDKGWNAYIDGFKTEHIRVNYILRALIVPEGVHTIEFKFEPKTYAVSQKVALGTSILVVLMLLGIIAYTVKKSKVIVDKKE